MADTARSRSLYASERAREIASPVLMKSPGLLSKSASVENENRIAQRSHGVPGAEGSTRMGSSCALLAAAAGLKGREGRRVARRILACAKLDIAEDVGMTAGPKKASLFTGRRWQTTAKVSQDEELP